MHRTDILRALVLVVITFASVASFSIRGLASTLLQLLEVSKHKNYAVQAKAEEVYRARKEVRVSLGRLLPSLNFGVAVALPQQDYLDFAGGVLGFLFPSHWFAWSENRLFYQAERHLFSVIIANEVNAVHGLIAKVHAVIVLLDIFVEIDGKVEELVQIAKNRLEYGEDTADHYLFFKNMIQKLRHDQIELERSIANQKASLGFALGLERKEIEHLAIPRLDLPELKEQLPIDRTTLYRLAKKRSLEKKALAILAVAAKRSRYERTFSFASATGLNDSGLGLGYKSYLRVGRSHQRSLEIEQKRLRGRLFKTSSKIANDQKHALRLYSNSIIGLNNAKSWLEILRQQYLEGGEFEPLKYSEAIESQLSFASYKSQAQHGYLISQVQVDRLAWDEQIYGDLYRLEPSLANHPLGKEPGGVLRRWLRKLKRNCEDRRSRDD